MDMWMKIAYAVALGAMVIFLLPRAKAMMANSRKAEAGEWRGVIIPLLLVILFVVLLIQSVQ